MPKIKKNKQTSKQTKKNFYKAHAYSTNKYEESLQQFSEHNYYLLLPL